MAIKIRAATRDDADFLAQAMLSASRGHLGRGIWDLIVDTDEASRLEYLRLLAVAEPLSPYHYKSHLIAEVDGHPSATLSGFDMRNSGLAVVGQAMANVQKDLGWTEADLAALRQRLVPAWTCFLPEIGADWRIDNVATILEYRRRGLANMLVNEMIQEGINCKCKLAQIEILIGNDAAQATYEKLGFRVFDEKRSVEFAAVLDAPGLRRLVREL
ncbi:MAG: GNAT family N-acetyltransferase [Acidobacteriia bacterium]|nr:GNAT family N-acetyltransferase [Terriglobia bacterium]